MARSTQKISRRRWDPSCIILGVMNLFNYESGSGALTVFSRILRGGRRVLVKYLAKKLDGLGIPF